MNFHLEFTIPPFPHQLNYRDKLLFIGSCFAENIGVKMEELKFRTVMNPHGVLYNPLAIEKAISRYVNNGLLNEDELFFANECWNSWEHHSRYSHPDKVLCLQQINTSITAAHEQLKNAKWLFITFGTAFSYSLRSSGIPVANCHKVPQKEFTKSLLNPEEIITAYKDLFTAMEKLNPELKIVLTVSPVRYVRDGAVENNISKAILLQSVHHLVEQHAHVFYFPAYELVIDDLRDYRFYKEDLVHPNEQAIGYVFEKLKDAAFSEEAKETCKEISEIRNAAAHRPFNESSEAHKKFKAVFVKRCTRLQQNFPFLNFDAELNYFTS
jgi:hypothetical protein